LVLLVTNVFGISPLLVWREMVSEEAQICDTHSLKLQAFLFYYNEKKIKIFSLVILLGTPNKKIACHPFCGTI
jgi:hypothetical protein